jgi:enediyne biosynthesis protein E4
MNRCIPYHLAALLCIVTALLVSCDGKNETLFTKLGPDDTGIDFINENHETEKTNILSYEYYYNGGGVALGDINNDGLTDIYFTSNIFPNKLYLNKGNFEFEDITPSSGTACEVGWKTGVTMVDINQDGLLDIYVCRSGSPDKERRRNILLINNGDLTFTDEAKKYGLDDTSYSTQAAFFDYDRDNDLDVLLLNHSLLEISNVYNITVKNSDVRFPEVGNKLLRNDNGLFTDISDTTGIYGSAFNYGLGISISDINNDGWPDIYAGCDYTGRDRMLYNDHGKFFTDETNRLSHISKFTMGTDIADIDGDGNMDILTLDMLPEDNYRQKQLMGADKYDVFNTMVKSGLHAQYMRNMLHLNNGNGTFSEIGQLAGISNTDWSWSALIQDFDNDGVQDIFISNGFKRDLTNNDFAKFQVATQMEEARKRGEKVNALDMINKFDENKLANYFYKGNGDLTYADVTRAWGFHEPSITNGVAYGDLDNDGDLDRW